LTRERVSDRQFASTSHRYTDPRTGERVTSVTTIVGSFDSGDKLGAGAAAAAKLERQGINYREEWNRKRDRGTRVHGYAHLWAAGKTAVIEEEDEAVAQALADFCRHHRPTWIEVEQPVVSFEGYGGRFDAVVEIDGEFWLLDFKTGRHYPIELTLQLAGYRYADGIIEYDADGWATSLRDMPFIHRCGALYLDDEGFKLEPVDVGPDDHEAFLRLLEVKNWSRGIEKAERARKTAARKAAGAKR
jgi:hypothetical protein